MGPGERSVEPICDTEESDRDLETLLTERGGEIAVEGRQGTTWVDKR